MKNKILCMIAVFVLTVSSAVSVSAAKNPDLEITADSAILMDAKTGDILYKKQIDKKQYPASITKLMTVLLALENYNPQKTIKFSKNAVFGIERNSSHIAADVDEELTLEQCMYAIMLNSANEVSMAVAEDISGSVENFAELMNKKAKELGCKNTNFVNPHGLHDDNHYTTAYDMALIGKELIKNDTIKKIMETTYYEIPPTNKQPETRYLYAQHKMIKKNSTFFYESCEGGKTGFTDMALNTLVTFAKKGDTELICVVLKDNGTNIYKDTTKLFDYGFENYKTSKIYSAGKTSYTASVKETFDGTLYEKGDIYLEILDDIYKTVPIDTDLADIEVRPEYQKVISAPVFSGDKIGSVKFMLDGKLLFESPLISQNTVSAFSKEEIAEIKNSKTVSFIKKIGTIAVIAISAITIIIFILNEIKYKIKQHQRRKKRMMKRKKFKENN